MKIIGYHGSQTKYFEYEPDRALYFTTDKQQAESYAKREWDEGLIEGQLPVVYTVEINIDKPLIIEDSDKFFDFCDSSMNEYLKDEIIKTGYDSAIYDDKKHNTKLIAVFNENQFKIIKKEILPKSYKYYYPRQGGISPDDVDEYYYDELDESAYNYGVFYHGTNNKFDSFDETYQNGGYLGKGFYFSLSQNMAKSYGQNIVKAKLNYKNSFIFDETKLSDKQLVQMLNTTKSNKSEKIRALNEYKKNINDDACYDANKNLFDFIDFYYGDSTLILKQLGYDSIDNIERDSEFVVFNENQINIINELDESISDNIYENKLPNVNSLGEPIAEDEESLRNFWNWFNGSKIVDKQGNPLVIYHGTNAEFDEFSNERVGDYGKGFYFVSSKIKGFEYAIRKGGNIVNSYYLSIKNPYIARSSSTSQLLCDLGEKFTKRGLPIKKEKIKNILIENGYDGLIIPIGEKPFGFEYFMVFNPNQIKSINNNGNWSNDTNNINESVENGFRPMIYPNPSYTQFHKLLNTQTTYGKLSAIIDGDNIYCWDSGLAHHSGMIDEIEKLLNIKISDDAIWVRFKAPNYVWVSAEYFDDYSDDELDDLENQDFETELENNKVIKKYFPSGIKITRFNQLNESIQAIANGVKLIKGSGDMVRWLQNNHNSRIIYDVEKDWYIVSNDLENDIHVFMIEDAVASGLYPEYSDLYEKKIRTLGSGEAGVIILDDNRFECCISYDKNDAHLQTDPYKNRYDCGDVVIFDSNGDFEYMPIYDELMKLNSQDELIESKNVKWEYCGNDMDDLDNILNLPFPKMISEVFFNNDIINESDGIVNKDDSTRFGGIYDTVNNQTLFFDKNTIYNMDEILSSLKDGICKFSYYKIGDKIIGGIVAFNKENAFKTMRMMEKENKDFEPVYYMVEIINGDNDYYFNMDNKGRIVYENLEKDYKLSQSNIQKMFNKHSSILEESSVEDLTNENIDKTIIMVMKELFEQITDDELIDGYNQLSNDDKNKIRQELGMEISSDINDSDYVIGQIIDIINEIDNQSIPSYLNKNYPMIYKFIYNVIRKLLFESIRELIEEFKKHELIYRMITTDLEPDELIQHIKENGVGNCWAKKGKEYALDYNFEGTAKYQYVFEGMVDLNDINWGKTMYLRFIVNEENEIRLKNDANVQILNIYMGDFDTDPKYFEPIDLGDLKYDLLPVGSKYLYETQK